VVPTGSSTKEVSASRSCAWQDRRVPPSQSTVKTVFAMSGGACAFPGCDVRLTGDSPVPLQMAQIASSHLGAPRHDSGITAEEAQSPGNFLVLCPQHHVEVDTNPGSFDVEALREMRAARVLLIGQGAATTGGRGRFDHVVSAWAEQRSNDDEEYWQRFFETNTWVLPLLIPSSTLVLRSKCYVGGKTVDNTGANPVDFLAHGTANVALIEIKTPRTKLISGKYRGNVFLPSRELVGASMQVIEYQASLVQSLSHVQPDDLRLEAPDPLGIVIAGDLEWEGLGRKKRRSFELFRQSLRNVTVVTYDELFERLSDIERVMNGKDS
jgi:hypothetical protein